MSDVQRLVLDTSTLVGAVLRPNSVPRQAFLAAVRLYELCVSQATLAELQEVMRRPKFDRYAPLLASRLWRPCEAPIFAPHGLA